MKFSFLKHSLKKRSMASGALSAALALFLAAGCGKAAAPPQSQDLPPAGEAQAQTEEEAEPGSPALSQMDRVNGALSPVYPQDDYRTTYEVFVYSFADSNGDGIGDLKGLTQALDYIGDGDPSTRGDLDCSQIWMTPVFPSPTYHKYDAVDYMDIDPDFGTLEDFDTLLAECHKRGIRLVIDLAFNHTSVDHPWFRQAADYLKTLPAGKDPVYEECPYVWYYNFTKEPYNGCAPLDDSDWYYEARFWEGMPDLNLSTPDVKEELSGVMRFWLERGVDGLRMDAVTSYYTDNIEASIDFLHWVTDTAKSIKPEAYLVGECWASQDLYARYYDSGIDSLFDFAFSGADGLIANVVKGSRKASAFGRALEEEEALYASHNPSYVNAPFYTNHDLARSAGYYAYDDGSRTKLSGGLNLLMTGNAFIYYGEELGMKGSGKDENKRAPMYWVTKGEDPSASEEEGALSALMTAGPPDMDKVDMKFDGFDRQKDDPYSVYNYFRNAVLLRNAFPVIAGGKTSVVDEMTGDSVCAFLRTGDGKENSPESVLIVINTSDQAQKVALSGEGEAFGSLSGLLTVSEEEVLLDGKELTLPPFGIAILTGGGD